MSSERDQRAKVQDSQFQGPTVIQGEQHIHQYGKSASGPSPGSPQDQNIRAQGEHEHLRRILLRAAWIASAVSWGLGGTQVLWALRVSFTTSSELVSYFWLLVAWALVGAALDVGFFRLRRRWVQQGRYWLSTEKPTMGYEILVRIFLCLLVVLPLITLVSHD